MQRLLRISLTALTVALAFFAAPAAMAGPRKEAPTFLSRQGSFPCAIALVGLDSQGNPDPAGAFSVSITDIAGNPVDGSAVVLDFSDCPDISICSAQAFPVVHVDCANHWVAGFTNSLGQVTFTVVGGGSGHQPCSSIACMRVYADWVLLTDGINHPLGSVSIMDEDGGSGVGAADLSRLIADSFSQTYCARSDLDHAVGCIFSVGAADVSHWLTSFFKGYVNDCGSISAGYCP
jgi:hypothetical protein